MKRIEHLRLRNYTGWHCDSLYSAHHRRQRWVDGVVGLRRRHKCDELEWVRLVHPKSCRYDARTVFRNRRSVVEGLCLERFIGPDGLITRTTKVQGAACIMSWKPSPKVAETCSRSGWPAFGRRRLWPHITRVMFSLAVRKLAAAAA